MLSKSLTSKKPRSLQKQLQQQRNKYFNPSYVFGLANKPRYHQPSMYEILSWGGKSYYTKDYNRNTGDSYNQNYTNSQDNNKNSQNRSMVIERNNVNTNERQNNRKQVNLNQNIRNRNQQETNYQNYKQVQNNTNSMNSTKLKKKPVNQLNHKNNFANSRKNYRINTDTTQQPRYLQAKKTIAQRLLQTQDIDPQSFDRLKNQSIKKFKQTTRDLSNTAFLTYFNKPPFQNYGRSNRNNLGVLYGDYMYSHSVYPHTGDNKPANQQSYNSALLRARSAQNIRPHPPLTRKLQQNIISGYLTLSLIHPKKAQFQSLKIKHQTKLQDLPQFNIRKNKNDNQFHQEYLKSLEEENNKKLKQNNKNQDQQDYNQKNMFTMSGKSIKYKKKL